jgi:hypothetical protein
MGAPVTPLYATADGGAIVTSTTQCSRNIVTQNICTPQLGTLYTVDQNGNVTAQTPDTGAVYSWTNQWYDPPASGSTVSGISMPPIILASTFAAVLEGNLSLNGTSLKQQWFPPLESGKNDAIYDALDDLVSRLNDPAISALAQTSIFNKLGNDANGFALTTQSFLRYLTSKRPLFYNGLISSYCYDSLTGAPCTTIPVLSWFNGETVEHHLENNPDEEASTRTPSYPQLTFFRPNSILDASQGRNLGNESMIFHEALHGVTGKFDYQILEIFGLNGVNTPSCNISNIIENSVLSYSAGLDQTTTTCPSGP